MATANYGNAAYWEDRYKRDPEPFDWYQRFTGLSELISKYFRKSDAVLMLGCGTSRLSEELYDSGFSSITNIDYSPSAIELMSAKHRGKEGMSWQVVDATALSFPDGYFDAVLDKGTLDSVLCGENSTSNATKMLAETSRVLKAGGNYMVISYGQPESRLTYLEKEDYKWRVTVHTIPKPTIAGAPVPDASDASAVHYVYICHKTA